MNDFERNYYVSATKVTFYLKTFISHKMAIHPYVQFSYTVKTAYNDIPNNVINLCNFTFLFIYTTILRNEKIKIKKSTKIIC